MTLRERIRAADRLQKRRGFKIIASIVVVALAAAAYGWFFVQQTTGETMLESIASAERQAIQDQIDAGQLDPRAADAIAQGQSDVLALLSSRDPTVAVGIGALVGTGVVLVVVWLGLLLTYLALGLVAGAGAVPMLLFDQTRVYGQMLLGAVALTASFSALMQALRLVLSSAHPIPSIARNVLAEAVRLKISLVFIVILVLALAVLPTVLDGAQPLRYRVQSFLQYATGISFWIIALLVVTFSVATVAFEQRDKIIQQTMTKPVAAWEYIVGKWLGVVVLAAILLGVSASGVFLFTEHLRRLPAIGEVAPYVSSMGPRDVAEDRLVLETQVLTARRAVTPRLPFAQDDPNFLAQVDSYIEREQAVNPIFGNTPAARQEVTDDLYRDMLTAFMSIDPQRERSQVYVFADLAEARDNDRPLTFRYRINAEGNRPDTFYALTFILDDGTPIVRPRNALGFTHTLSLPPGAVGEQSGELRLQIFNGELGRGPSGEILFAANPGTATFPPGGLEISYVAGSYMLNFARVVMVLWIKLAFLSMVAITSATFLSFPVATLVTMGTFLIAEGARFIAESVTQFGVKNPDGEFTLWRAVIRDFADVVSDLFIVYAELRPTERLADGRLLSWGEVGGGVLVLGLTTGALFGLGIVIFRRRELATYSGR